jgi:cytoskeletal protein CcmA (bactofilin family)
MRKKNRQSSDGTFLDKDVSIEGLLEFQQSMRVEGRVKGQVRSREGTLIVGEQAVLEGDIHVAVALIRGRVNGTLTASTRVEMEAPAVMEGDICSPAVSIARGVEFNGKCIMDGKTESSQKHKEAKKPLTISKK